MPAIFGGIMREIKFRAWDIHNKKWTLPLVACSGRTTLVEPFNHRKDTEGNLIEIKLMQYTGLRDKNGKEIYEGDVVKSPLYGQTIGKIVFKGGCFVFWWGSDVASRTAAGGFVEQGEIIGNIYENPELSNGVDAGNEQKRS